MMKMILIILIATMMGLTLAMILTAMKLENKLKTAEDRKNGELTALAANVVKLNERIDELEKTPHDRVEDELEEARAKVLKEYIDAVVNYTPYGGDK